MMKVARYILMLSFLFISPWIVAQEETRTNIPEEGFGSGQVDQDSTKNEGLIVDGANSQFFDASEGEDKLYLRGDVRLTHDSIYMFCDTAVLVKNDMWANGNISIIKNDTIRLFSDSLLYRGDSLMAYFVGNVVMEDGDNQKIYTSFLQYDLEKEWAIYTDTALIISGDTEIKSKRGIYHADEDYVNFYESVTITGPDFNLLSDSLRFYTVLKKAVFLSPTIINQEGKEIYSESGYYHTEGGQSLFAGNAQFLEGETTSTADTIKNNEETGITELIGNAVYDSPKERATGEKIIFNDKTEEFEIIGNGYFKNPDNEVTGEVIRFNRKTDNVKVIGRSFLSTGTMLINADDLDYKKEEGVAVAQGNVLWQDTSSNYEIDCDHATYIDSTSFMKAYNLDGKPVLKNELDEGDTLFLSGDTLISFTNVIGADTFRYFNAYQSVEMINGEMQAVCDSLHYNGKDSIFTLIGNPIMWSDSTQYTADTIHLIMKNNKIDTVKMRSGSMIIMSSDEVMYDQIAGANIDAVFIEGDIDKMYVNGGAESVYYLKDEEDAYMGVNETKCTNMIFLFENGELSQTRYYTEPISKMTPMDKANHSALRLTGFEWEIQRRPITVLDLYY